MKEKEVRLSQEEIDYLLNGSIHWNDIETRVEAPLRRKFENPQESGSSSDKGNEPESFLTNARLDETGYDQRKAAQKPDELKIDFPESELERKSTLAKPFLEGKQVYWVLAGVVSLTLGIWAYFVFA
jgi:hypothetical protein